METATAATAAAATESKPAQTNGQPENGEKEKVVQDILDLMDVQSLKASAAVMKRLPWGGSLTEREAMAYEAKARQYGGSCTSGDFEVLAGRLYATLQFRLRKADETGQFDGFLRDEPLPKADWEGWGIRSDAKHAWICTIKRRDHGASYTEVGFAGGTRDTESNKGMGQPVAKAFPRELASKRARARTLAIAFPLGFPAAEEWSEEMNARDERPTIERPRRKSDPPADRTASPVPDESNGATDEPGEPFVNEETPEEAANEGRGDDWAQATITGVSSKDGTGKNGKPYTIHKITIQGNDGPVEMSTFDEGVKLQADNALAQGGRAKIQFEKNANGYFNALAVEAIES